MIHSLFLAVVLASTAAIPNTPSIPVKSVAGKAIRIDCTALSRGQSDCTVELGALVHAASLTRAVTLAAAILKDTTRLLIETCGPSRPAGFHPTGYCAAGEECDLVWLELDRRGTPLRSASYLVDSCIESAVPDGDLCHQSGTTVTCSYSNYHAKRAATVNFQLAEGSNFDPLLDEKLLEQP